MTEVVKRSKRRAKRSWFSRRRFCSLIMSVLLSFIQFFRYYIDLIIDKVFGIYYDSRRAYLPSVSNPILLESATSLAKKIRSRELRVEDVVKAFVDQARSVNPIINAIVDERYEEALEEARQLDKDLDTGHIQDVDFQNKPFLGVPYTVKESTSVEGLSSTYGLIKRKGRKASFDADCVERIKKAGGICIGVTNVPQLNYWVETSNPVYGLTKNPYNTTRNVGGSSGGEGAILATCGSAFGLGTDIGGSIRLPSFMCGVFGHKPTSGLISTKGLTFRTGKEEVTMVVAGPMAKKAEDLGPLLKVLSGENHKKLSLDEAVDVKNLNIYYVDGCTDIFVSPLRPNIIKSYNKTVEFFKNYSKKAPEKLEFKARGFGGRLWKYWMTQESGDHFANNINNQEGEVNVIVEIIKGFLFLGDFTMGTLYNLINTLLPKQNKAWAEQETNEARKELTEKLGKNGVLLYYSAPFTASYHHTALLRPFNFNLFSLWNALKFPVTQVPLGLDEDGLPLGIQVVAAPYQDHLCLAVAKELEAQFGGFVPPFRFDKNKK